MNEQLWSVEWNREWFLLLSIRVAPSMVCVEHVDELAETAKRRLYECAERTRDNIEAVRGQEAMPAVHLAAWLSIDHDLTGEAHYLADGVRWVCQTPLARISAKGRDIEQAHRRAAEMLVRLQ